MYSIPHIINLSIKDIKPELLVKALSEKEIYISYKDGINDSIMALYHDEKRARSSIRISISHITTIDEIDRFINNFYNVYEDLASKK